MGREMIDGEEAVDRAVAASMRPGPIGPGNNSKNYLASLLNPASMRPGPIGPGNAVTGNHVVIDAFRFNEARPNWAGK